MTEALTRARREIDRLSSIATLYQITMAIMIDERPDAVERFTIDGTRYRVSLYRSVGPHGGIVVTAFKVRGQRSSVCVHYLDDERQTYRHSSSLMQPYETALERLTIARNRLVSAASVHVGTEVAT